MSPPFAGISSFDLTSGRAGGRRKNGATDVGITKDVIKLGSINMHVTALGNAITAPVGHGNLGMVSVTPASVPA